MKPARAYFNVLKMRLNIRLRREVVSNYPIAAFMEPTTYCNLQCPSCPTGLQLDLRPRATLDESLFRVMIDETGDYLFRLLLYNWGEPLLHKRAPEMIAYAKTKEIEVSLSTNLSLPLSDDYLERLVRSGLDTMIISLDGATETSYAKYRRGGQFERVRENLRRLHHMRSQLGMSTPRLVWQFVVFRHNEQEIDLAKSLYRSWGADEISFVSGILPAPPHDREFQASTLPQFDMYQPDHVNQREARRQMKNGEPCSWLYGMLVLNPDGSVSPCCAAPSAHQDFGRVGQGDRFFDVWNNHIFRRARALFRKPPTRAEHVEPDTSLLTGMAVTAANRLAPEQLVCEKCPIPFMQNYTSPILDDVLRRTLRALLHDRSPRALLNYLLMGAPLPSRTAVRTFLRDSAVRLIGEKAVRHFSARFAR